MIGENEDEDVHGEGEFLRLDCYDPREKSPGGSLKVVGLEEVIRPAGSVMFSPVLNLWSQCLIPWRTKVLDCQLMCQWS